MKLTDHLIIFFTILGGFWLDASISLLTIPFNVEPCIGLLVFCYWVFAIPEKLHSSSAFMYGLLVDLFFGQVIGLHMLFFIATSYIIHVYVFRFRLFSYLQLTIFFCSCMCFFSCLQISNFIPSKLFIFTINFKFFCKCPYLAGSLFSYALLQKKIFYYLKHDQIFL